MTIPDCNVTLHYKIMEDSGRLAQIMSRLSAMVRQAEMRPSHIDPSDHHDDLEKLLLLCQDYGLQWMMRAADRFKELYNRTQGP